ncbi:hypothetical protein FC72_GL000015 [Companilactobacillus tucceti DSM 20183]|uniref:Uncharacterized protein n=1 Tax=Companilactobacillus tucceti DSM 20183 TaxID=1423811 RepID=A0A0R1J2L5_9LACO|nr:hypothetical protein [Companilactobacillus tucceti]KRK65574.1 hypothetical protein FC72_GL000015 [Companilactobacillus tucceti DSM 20183]
MVNISTYREWANLFKKFDARENDEQVLEDAKHGTLVWQTGVADRFMKRLTASINKRMNDSVSVFEKQISQSGIPEANFVKSIHQLKDEFETMRNFTNIEAIPTEQRRKLVEMLYESRKDLQSNLEESAKTDQSGKLSSLVRNNRIDN